MECSLVMICLGLWKDALKYTKHWWWMPTLMSCVGNKDIGGSENLNSN